MKTVILCGGKGTRMDKFTQSIPKPLAPIGDKPVLWHIMNIYACQGYNDFILCLGYKGEIIRDYFKPYKDWNITFIDTGQDTNTGGRIKKIESNIVGDTFFATYADGLANVNLKELLAYHNKNQKIATITAVNPFSPFGMLELDHDGAILKFKEKPLMQQLINGWFFIFNRKIFKCLDENSILETEPFEKLVAEKQIFAYKFTGFWKSMDTFKDVQELNELYARGNCPWMRSTILK